MVVKIGANYNQSGRLNGLKEPYSYMRHAHTVDCSWLRSLI